MDQIEVLGKRSSSLTTDDILIRKRKERTMLDAMLSSDAVIMSYKAILKACAMSLPDLWRSRRCLSKTEGFDHSVVNGTLGACGDLPEPLEIPCLPFIWQCGENKGLINIITPMEFDFSKAISPCSGKSQVEFTESGMCHGFVLWIDWVMEFDNTIVLSTGPGTKYWRYWKQGVKLLAKPVSIEKSRLDMGSASAEIKATFNPSDGELRVEYAFT